MDVSGRGVNGIEATSIITLPPESSSSAWAEVAAGDDEPIDSLGADTPEGRDLLIIAHRLEHAREPDRVHLVRRLPPPLRSVGGDLSETEKVLVGLALIPRS